MSRYFHGHKKKYPYFEGWYLKHQNGEQTIALIPAVHADESGEWSASIQMITEEGSWQFRYPIEECQISRREFKVKIGQSFFTEKGMYVDLKNEEIQVAGCVRYGHFHRLKSDIMGYFRFLPFLQCSHDVISMAHHLTGTLTVNEKQLCMTGGKGYIEADRGTSFPEHYLWTQCGFEDNGKNSIMLSIADIPMLGRQFLGCICAVFYHGKEYRLATYNGVKIAKYGEGRAEIRQGNLLLKVARMDNNAFALRAPASGQMSRTIKESPACKVRYQFWCKGQLLFDIVSEEASFEQVREDGKSMQG